MNTPVISPAVCAGTGETGWSATIDACHGLLAIALGTNNMDDTFERACREADGKAAARFQDPRLARSRRLLEDDVSLERAQHEIMRARPAPETFVEALMYSLRRGIEAIIEPDNQRRLAELSEDQLLAVCQRLQHFKPNIAPAWPPEEVEALASIWSTVHVSC